MPGRSCADSSDQRARERAPPPRPRDCALAAGRRRGDAHDVPHPRVEEGIEEVGAQVEEDHRRAEDEEEALEHRQVGRVAAPRRSARPSPGHEKTVSTAIAPERTKPKLIAISVVEGSSALRTAWRFRTCDVAQPLRARERQVVLAHRVEQRRAHDERVLAEVGERRA